MRVSRSYQALLKQIGKKANDKRRMVAIVFAHPEHELAKREIIPFFPHMDLRSGSHIDFHFAGYGEEEDKLKDGVEVELVYSDSNIYFSQSAYLGFLAEMQNASEWKPTGGMDFLLLDVGIRNASHSLDFSNVINIELITARERKGLPSLPIFFESIFRFAEDNGGRSETWSFSDRNIPSLALTAIEELMPAGIFSLYKNGSMYAVRDYSKKKKLTRPYSGRRR